MNGQVKHRAAGSGGGSRRRFLKNAAIMGGAAALSGCAAGGGFGGGRVAVPSHNERTRGWLKFLWEKATFPDDWGYRGDEELPWGIQVPRGEIDWTYDGRGPHPWWDQYTTPPMLSYPRFDLADSSYTVLLMADQTPAWREVYTRILDELAARHTAYWAAIDWNTFIGPSPYRGRYPPAQTYGWPDRLRGNYDAPGWTANGVEPWGLQRDPIGADGNLFFRGWLNLLLSIYKYVSGDDKWDRPWHVAGYENEQFEWTRPAIVEHLRQQYLERPEGPHCENTKIWPFCNSAAGLGLYLSDQLGRGGAHGVFENWVEFMRDNYMGINDRQEIEWTTLYYDPLENFKLNTPGVSGAGAGVAFYLLPQSPEIATDIYEAIANSRGWRDRRQEIQPDAIGLAMARALGDDSAAERLAAAAERAAEPRWFGEEQDKFGWWFHYGEPWPRGQESARMMLGEIAGSNWMDAFQVKERDRYGAPTVEGVDFPTLGIHTAWNDKTAGVMHIGTYSGERAARGQATTLRVSNLPDAATTAVTSADGTVGSVRVVDAHTLLIETEVAARDYRLVTGYFGQQLAARPALGTGAAAAGTALAAARRRSAADNVRAAEAIMSSGAAGCPCCAKVA